MPNGDVGCCEMISELIIHEYVTLSVHPSNIHTWISAVHLGARKRLPSRLTRTSQSAFAVFTTLRGTWLGATRISLPRLSWNAHFQ